MPKLPRPPRRATPDSFYRDYVPELWKSLPAAPAAPESRATICIELPERSERFTLNFEGTEVTVGTEPCDAPLLTVSSDYESWKLACLDLLPRILKKLESWPETRRAPNPDRALRWASRPGGLEIELTDDAGDQARFSVRIGEGSARRAMIRATETDLWRLLEPGARLSSLLRSKLELDGDAGYPIQLAQLLESD